MAASSLEQPSLQEQQLELRHGYELMHKHLLKSMNAYAIVLSILLATSYSGFLQFPMPLSNSPPPPIPPLSDPPPPPNSSTFQKLFIYSNGLSFFSSVAGLLFFASSSFSPLLALDSRGLGNAEKEVQKRLNLLADMLPKFVYVIFFFGLSLTSCVVAYVFAGLATVRTTIPEELAVIITAGIGGLIYVQALWVCGYDSCRLIHGSIRRNEKLWEAFQKQTWFGHVLTHYVDFLCGDVAANTPNPHALNGTEHNGSAHIANGDTRTDAIP